MGRKKSFMIFFQNWVLISRAKISAPYCIVNRKVIGRQEEGGRGVLYSFMA